VADHLGSNTTKKKKFSAIVFCSYTESRVVLFPDDGRRKSQRDFKHIKILCVVATSKMEGIMCRDHINSLVLIS
jgi:hypothetical protein